MKKITQDTQFIINNKTYDLSMKKIHFTMFQYTHQDLSYREQKVEFLKNSIAIELDEYMGGDYEAYRQSILNRIEMVDLLAQSGASIEDIEFHASDLISNEELESYRNFELVKVGFYKEINLRR